MSLSRPAEPARTTVAGRQSSTPPRVLFFDAYPDLLGGGQRLVLAIARELDRRGAPATLVVPGEGRLVEQALEVGIAVRVVALPPALGHYGRTTTGARVAAAGAALPVAWRRLRRVVLATPCQVVHANDHRGALLMAPAARAAGRRVVWHAHSVDVDGHVIERAAGRAVDAVVAPSASALHELVRIPPRVTRVVVPGAVTDDVLGLGRATPLGRGRVVTAARLHPAKGVDIAIRAIALLAGAGLDVTLDVHGAAQTGAEVYATDLRALAAALGVASRVTFHEQGDAPHRSWLDADVYVQPSRAETFGIAAAEAMALGLPTVATTVGGLPELIDHDRTGMLVPPDDPAALAGAIRSLLTDPVRARRIADAARMHATTLTVERAVDRMVDVWRQVLAR